MCLLAPGFFIRQSKRSWIPSFVRKREKDNLKIQRGFNSVIKLKEFRKLWISQIFSQLADKFYIVLMIYIIAEFIIPANKQGLEGIVQAVPNSFILDEQEVNKININKRQVSLVVWW